MKILSLGAIALIGTVLIGGQAQAGGFDFGSVTLGAGETKTVGFGSTGRDMRVCNDFFSSGRVIVSIGSSDPHDLSPGVCAEEIGDRMIVQNLASGTVTVDFRSLSDTTRSGIMNQ